jgi:AcrR family transcriptional regulator
MSGVAVEKWTPERRKERTRIALVDAAAAVFGRRGFNGASLDEIAETAGYTRGAIYKHFDGKEELLFAVVDRVNERALATFAEASANGTIVFRNVPDIIDIWRRLFVLDTELHALTSEVYLNALRNEKVRERLLVHRRRNTEMIAAFMEQQLAASDTIPNLPIRTLADIFLITSDGFAQAAHIDPNAYETYATFLEVMITALIGPEE